MIADNVYVTTSGRFSKDLLDYTLKVMGEHKIMLATDYPYESLNQSMSFIRDLNLPDPLLQKICLENANRLGIKLGN